jgi:hypothetical protein
MAWTFDKPFETLSDTATVGGAEQLWERESLGGLTEDNNPIPPFVIWLVALTVLHRVLRNLPAVGTAADRRPVRALRQVDGEPGSAGRKGRRRGDAEDRRDESGHGNDALLSRHPLTMDDLRLIAPQIKALETRAGVDLKDYTVVGANVVIANFEGNYRPTGRGSGSSPGGTRVYHRPVLSLGVFLGVFLVVKRLPPVAWQPRHGVH